MEESISKYTSSLIHSSFLFRMDDSPSDRISLVGTPRGKVAKNKNRSCKKICEICSTILINIVPAIVTMMAILIWIKIQIKKEEGSLIGEFVKKKQQCKKATIAKKILIGK